MLKVYFLFWQCFKSDTNLFLIRITVTGHKTENPPQFSNDSTRKSSLQASIGRGLRIDDACSEQGREFAGKKNWNRQRMRLPQFFKNWIAWSVRLLWSIMMEPKYGAWTPPLQSPFSLRTCPRSGCTCWYCVENGLKHTHLYLISPVFDHFRLVLSCARRDREQVFSDRPGPESLNASRRCWFHCPAGTRWCHADHGRP